MNWYNKYIKTALVAPELMTDEIQNQISVLLPLLETVKVGLSTQDFSSVSSLKDNIEYLNMGLERNPDTRFAPMKSHSNQLLQYLDIVVGKFNNSSLTAQDVQAVVQSINNYINDLQGVV